MIRRFVVIAGLALMVAGCSEAPAGEPVVRSVLDGSDKDTPEPAQLPPPNRGPSDCSEVMFEGVPLTHCVADPAKHRIDMANLGADKQPFGSLSAFAATVDPATIAFAVNGGMYGDDLKPIGYFVQKGDRLAELNRGDGDGNFYLKPNGVFFGTGGAWKVLGSNTFFNSVKDRPQFGTQSGPLLVVDGKLHPEVQDNGPSKAIRNGVGVDASGKAHFVVSGGDISFGQLARYFRDKVKAANALYLDGQVSSLWNPATARQDTGRVGPIIVVTKRGEAARP